MISNVLKSFFGFFSYQQPVLVRDYNRNFHHQLSNLDKWHALHVRLILTGIFLLSIISVLTGALFVIPGGSINANAAIICQDGYTYDATAQNCKQITSKTCPTDFTLQSDGSCTKTALGCPKGGAEENGNCVASESNYVIPAQGCYLGGTPEDWWCGFYYDTTWVSIGRGQCPGVSAVGENLTDNFISVNSGPYAGAIVCGRAGARWGYVGGSPIYGNFSYPMENVTTINASVCPANYIQLTPTQCFGGASDAPTYIVDEASIGNGTCVPSSVLVTTLISTCTFPLTGAPNGSYTLPSQGLYAGVRNTSNDPNSYLGDGSACTVQDSSLVCANIPTSGAIAQESGTVKAVVLHQPNVAWIENKASVEITIPRIITNSEIGNSTDCTTGKTVTIGQTYTCTFPLSGTANNTYALPEGGITASTSTANGNSTCTIMNNGTPQASLTCTSIPTANGSAGNQNVLLSVGTNTAVDKGDVVLVNPQPVGTSNSGTNGGTMMLVRSGGNHKLVSFVLQSLILVAIAGIVIQQLHIFTKSK